MHRMSLLEQKRAVVQSDPHQGEIALHWRTTEIAKTDEKIGRIHALVRRVCNIITRYSGSIFTNAYMERITFTGLVGRAVNDVQKKIREAVQQFGDICDGVDFNFSNGSRTSAPGDTVQFYATTGARAEKLRKIPQLYHMVGGGYQ